MDVADIDIGVRIGEVIADKYRVERRLGIGGMGAVVVARHLELGARVAIKVLLPQTARDPDGVARFSREARAMFNLKSEHVAKVLDVGRLPKGGPFMVMEYLEGRDLQELLVERGKLAPQDTVHLVMQACEAVAEAHSLGIVHRDIKPQNLFVASRPDGTAIVKVLDFGISKVPLDSGEHKSLTHSSAVMGTPLYMSPEQLHSSADTDARTDIWAIGVVLYQMLTGTMPFDAPSAPALYALLLSKTPKPPRDLSPDIPEGLSDAIMKCLVRDRDERCASVIELMALLEPFDAAAGSSLRIRLPPPQTSEPRADDVVTTEKIQEGRTEITWGEGAAEKKKTAIVAMAGFAVIGAAAGFLLHALRSQPPATAEPIPVASASVAVASASDSAAASTIAPMPAPSDALAASTEPPTSPSASTSAHARTHAGQKPHPAAGANSSLLKQRTW